MPKSEVLGGARRKRTRRPPSELAVVEGQIVELCRDLAEQAKRMHQLQEQADELRRGIRQWAGESDGSPDREPVSRGARR